ncbi:MAG: hypothetical protein K6A40_07575 [Solobacterium sp.]|nr:hypothetical protein [Solobacterium sp.]
MKKLFLICAALLLTAGCAEEKKMHVDASFADTSWVGLGLSELVLRADGTFSWYQNEGKPEGDRYEGVYEAYRAEDAVKYVTGIETYKITEAQLEAMFDGEDEHTKENFIVYMLKDEHVWYEGKEAPEMCDELIYYGYLTENDTLLNSVNMRTGSLCTFEKKKNGE